MQAWADLLTALDHATPRDARRATPANAAAVQALVHHLNRVPRRDAAWALWLLAGGRPPARLSLTRLREAVASATGLAPWLLEASHAAAGDWAETLALVLPDASPPHQATLPLDTPPDIGAASNTSIAPPSPPPPGLAHWLETGLPSAATLAAGSPAQCADALRPAWSALNPAGRVVLHRLLTGTLRLRVTAGLLQRALAWHTGQDETTIAQHLARHTAPPRRPRPDLADFMALLACADRPVTGRDGATPAADVDAPSGLTATPAPADAPEDAPAGGQPLPFAPVRLLTWQDGVLAHPTPMPDLEPAQRDWLDRAAPAVPRHADLPDLRHAWAQWAYPGLRVQCVRQDGQVWLWRPDLTLVNSWFPEAVAQASALPEGCVLEVLLLAWPTTTPGRPGPLSQVQGRLNRAAPTAAQRAATPVRWLAVDLLQWAGQDLRTRPVPDRQARLADLCRSAPAGVDWPCAPPLHVPDAAALALHLRDARALGLSGVLLRQQAPGQADGVAWHISPPPLTLRAVLVHAQAGPGSGAASASVFSLAVWSRSPADADEVDAALAALARRTPPDPAALHLVTVTQVRDGFSADALRLLAQRVRETTLEKFGPVRTLRPTLLIEIAFEGLEPSTRHRCGLLLHRPRALRLCLDAPLHTAAHLDDLRRHLPGGMAN